MRLVPLANIRQLLLFRSWVIFEFLVYWCSFPGSCIGHRGTSVVYYAAPQNSSFFSLWEKSRMVEECWVNFMTGPLPPWNSRVLWEYHASRTPTDVHQKGREKYCPGRWIDITVPRNGMVVEARIILDEMCERNVFSWIAMVRGYMMLNGLHIVHTHFFGQTVHSPWVKSVAPVMQWPLDSGKHDGIFDRITKK